MLQPRLASRFARASHVLRSASPLAEDQIRKVAPSVFAEGKHESRSERYTYIPTIEILRGLAKEGFHPFMVTQGRTRTEGKAEYTKHMLRLRHAAQVDTKEGSHEIILINSHDGASSYQMMAGWFRFVCSNGLVCGNATHDVRVPHKGNITDNVIEGATRILDDFDHVNESVDGMRTLTLNDGEQRAFATAALALRYPDAGGDFAPAPITAEQLAQPRRFEDRASTLWTTFNRVQENAIRGGLQGRTANGRNMSTRPVAGIDGNVALNRGLWVLAEEMRKLKA